MTGPSRGGRPSRPSYNPELPGPSGICVGCCLGEDASLTAAPLAQSLSSRPRERRPARGRHRHAMVVEVLVPPDVIRIVKLASQQCTQVPQNGSERPVSPICVHSCESPRSLARSSRVATVYTNAPKRHREARSSHLCTLLRSQGHPQPKPTAQPCTRMPQNGTEGPFPPICVHSCVAPHGGDAHHAARAVTQPPTRTHEAPVPGTSLAHNWQLDGVPA